MAFHRWQLGLILTQAEMSIIRDALQQNRPQPLCGAFPEQPLGAWLDLRTRRF